MISLGSEAPKEEENQPIESRQAGERTTHYFIAQHYHGQQEKRGSEGEITATSAMLLFGRPETFVPIDGLSPSYESVAILLPSGFSSVSVVYFGRFVPLLP